MQVGDGGNWWQGSSASQVSLVVKNLPANAEDLRTWVWYMDHKDSLEEGMATHSSIIAWRISWTEDPGGL